MNLSQTIYYGHSKLVPVDYGDEFYLVRFAQRGTRLDCTGVFLFEIRNDIDRPEPSFQWQNKAKKVIKAVIVKAREKE